MTNYREPIRSNSAKRLPIVFCLDVSPSMGFKEDGKPSSIELLNAAVKQFVKELNEHPDTQPSAEVAFVTFSDNIVMDTPFQPVRSMQPQQFRAEEYGPTHMAKAVLRSIEKIERRRAELRDAYTGCYVPFLVLVTDGDPDQKDDPQEHNRAISLVTKHCESHVGASEIIVPFIIGVGEAVNKETLRRYSAGFVNGYFPIKDNNRKEEAFSKVFELIRDSAVGTINLNGRDQIENIQDGMNDTLDLLAHIME